MSDLDVYRIAADAYFAVRGGTWAGNAQQRVSEQPEFRAAVDAARAPLLAEVERLKAELAEAHRAAS